LTLDTGRRKREETRLCGGTRPKPDASSTDSRSITEPGCLTQLEKPTAKSDTPSLKGLWHLFYSAVGPQYIDHSSLEQVGKLCRDKEIESEGAITAFQQWIKYQNAASSPAADGLLVLVKFNVFRALLNNGRRLGFTTAGEYLGDDALSPFVNPMRPEESLPPFSSLPLALRPTKSQCQNPHHPWLDLFPDPVMRDNLIRATSAYDEAQLCADLIGLSSAATGRSGLIVWGEPWDPSGWEVTSPFLKNWGWALRGCEGLLRATNYWRRKRGEPALNFEGAVRH
jgi:hypothetical protein